MQLELELSLRLLAAVVFGSFIGFERVKSNHSAGLRTHILVCLASAGIMALGEGIVTDGRFINDVQRMGAGVIGGIGFLGAGCIMANGSRVRGLTTAAGILSTSVVGLITGMGYYVLAAVMTTIMILVFTALHPLTLRLQKNNAMESCRYIIGLQPEAKKAEVLDWLVLHTPTLLQTKTSEEELVVEVGGLTNKMANRLFTDLQKRKDVKSVTIFYDEN